MKGDRSTRRAPSGVYQWLIPLVLGLMALVLAAIVLALLAAVLGLWPGAT